MMKLAVWAREQGIDYKTAYRWYRSGILPVPSEQLPTGTILVFPAEKKAGSEVALYARVSGSDQKRDLSRQVARLVGYATKKGLNIKKAVQEVGSGLNGRRSKLMCLLGDASVGTIVVEHRDRLARFGSEYIEAALRASGRSLVIIDKAEMKDDLVQDMIDVLVSFSAKLYGRRSAKNRAKRALKAMEEV